jgi:hypothetical protein
MAIQWISGYPLIISNITGTTVTASGSINQSGQIAMMILPAASGVPTATGVYTHTASGVALASGLWDIETVASGQVVLLSGYGLSEETSYKMYLVGSGVTDGLMTTPTGLAFTTPDVTIPAWITGYPIIDTIATSTATVSMKLNDAGSGYFVILPSSYSAPNSAQIIAGTDANDAAVALGLKGGPVVLTSGVVAQALVTGLAYSTNYKIYSTAVDDGGNATVSVVSASFRAAVPKPGIVNSTFNKAIQQRRKLDNALRNM